MTIQIADKEVKCEVVLVNRIGKRVMIIAEVNKLPRAIITLEQQEISAEVPSANVATGKYEVE